MKEELWIDHSMPDTVKHYASNAQKAGLSGVVCSPLEAGLVQEACGTDFVTVTPGIRFADEFKTSPQVIPSLSILHYQFSIP